ncbi:hypothetical protein PF029_12765, partial [Enterococcus thailandicus]|uniref:hypothetical protein n=1 Tax=Enterococcus thailandicus TaxID=417368 RepID=UPI0022EBBE3E
MYKVVEGMMSLAERLGVKIVTNISVLAVHVEDKTVTNIQTDKGTLTCDILLSGAEYGQSETLLPPAYRQY